MRSVWVQVAVVISGLLSFAVIPVPRTATAVSDTRRQDFFGCRLSDRRYHRPRPVPLCQGNRGEPERNGTYVGYVAGHDPLHDFLSGILRDHLQVHQARPAYRVYRLSGSNEVYPYEEKRSGAKIICKFYGTRFAGDRAKANSMARQEYEGLRTLRGYDLVGSPHHVIRPFGVDSDINGVLAVEYYSGEEFSHAIR